MNAAGALVLSVGLVSGVSYIGAHAELDGKQNSLRSKQSVIEAAVVPAPTVVPTPSGTIINGDGSESFYDVTVTGPATLRYTQTCGSQDTVSGPSATIQVAGNTIITDQKSNFTVPFTVPGGTWKLHLEVACSFEVR